MKIESDARTTGFHRHSACLQSRMCRAERLRSIPSRSSGIHDQTQGPHTHKPRRRGGGDEGDRTPDLSLAKAALSHLSYIPTVRHSYSEFPGDCQPIAPTEFIFRPEGLHEPMNRGASGRVVARGGHPPDRLTGVSVRPGFQEWLHLSNICRNKRWSGYTRQGRCVL